MSPAEKEKRHDGRRALNGLVYCLIVLAAFLAAIAAWMRYPQGRRPGGSSVEPGDAIERQVEAFMPNLGFAEGWTQAGGLPQYTPTAPMCRFVCPQCGSCCWMRPGRGSPACPFCGHVMARQGPGISLAGRAPAGGTASPIPIQRDAIRPHGDRGVCTNCHTVVSFGVPQQVFTLAGAAQGELKALWRGAAAPAITPNAVRPTLIKEFGMEVCPARGAAVKVTGVMGNSHALNAGLRAGDIVIECNGARVRGVEQFQQLASRATPEADARIKILRDGRTRDLLIMVGEGEMEGFTAIQRP